MFSPDSEIDWPDSRDGDSDPDSDADADSLLALGRLSSDEMVSEPDTNEDLDA